MKWVFGDNQRLAGLLLVIASAQFLTLMMIGEAIAPNYSMHENAISDLGVIHETRLIFNSSLFTIGFLNLLAGYFFYGVHKNRILLILFAIAGVGAMGAAVFPLDNPVGIHGLFALIAFLFMNAEAIYGAKLLKGPLKIGSIFAGVAGLIFVVMMILVDGGSLDVTGSIGHGAVERMIVYPVLIWMVLVGGYLLGNATLRVKEPSL